MLILILCSVAYLAAFLLIIYFMARLMAKDIDDRTVNKVLNEASASVRFAVARGANEYYDGCDRGEDPTAALHRSLEVARHWLTKGATKFIETAYGDVNTYLATKIEEKVKQ